MILRHKRKLLMLIGCLILISCISSDAVLPPEAEHAFYDQVIDHPKSTYSCAVSSEKCTDVQIKHVRMADISPAMHAQGVEAAWCILFTAIQRHPINRDYYQIKEVVLITKIGQAYQAIETFDGHAADSQICPPTSAWW